VLNAIAEDLTRHSPDRFGRVELGRTARMILADSSSIDDSSTGCWEILNR
jgi:hypothetical protein